MNTQEQLHSLRSQLEELGSKLESWRECVALQEEVAFYSSSFEEFGRRLLVLEKKIALERNGEPVPIRILETTTHQAESPSADTENLQAAA